MEIGPVGNRGFFGFPFVGHAWSFIASAAPDCANIRNMLSEGLHALNDASLLGTGIEGTVQLHCGKQVF